MKGIAKHGFKSGTLPPPRQVVPPVLAEYEKERLARVRTGFQDPKMVPRGSTANPPGRLLKTAEQKIEASAKGPRQVVEPKSAQAELRLQMANIRRRYNIETLKTYAALEDKKAKARQAKHVANLKRREEALRLGDTDATLLTMPTVESSLLAGAMVVPRTPEEQEMLRMKREANRKKALHELMKKKYERVLELYQQTKSFIVSLDHLEREVEARFSTPGSMPSFNFPSNEEVLHARKADFELRKVQRELVQTLLGITSTNDPGLGEVRDALDGSSAAHLKQENSDSS